MQLLSLQSALRSCVETVPPVWKNVTSGTAPKLMYKKSLQYKAYICSLIIVPISDVTAFLAPGASNQRSYEF